MGQRGSIPRQRVTFGTGVALAGLLGLHLQQKSNRVGGAMDRTDGDSSTGEFHFSWLTNRTVPLDWITLGRRRRDRDALQLQTEKYGELQRDVGELCPEEWCLFAACKKKTLELRG